MRTPVPATRSTERRPLRVVVIDDDDSTNELLEVVFAREDIQADTFNDAELALEQIRIHPPQVVLTDLEMGGTSGLDVLRRVATVHPRLPVIVITGHADLDHAVSALRAGAHDFLSKPLKAQRVVLATRRAAQHYLLSDELRRLRHRVQARDQLGLMVGDSAPMRRVFELVDRIAPTSASVLVMGESGTGKELVARAVHDRSERHEGPFVAVNCAAVPGALLENELFGHVRGAFTDARQDRRGLFAAAEGGTLFLDEIGELPIELQPKLLRALQERRVRPVGGDDEIAFDARLVTATSRALSDDVEEGRFRRDLFYRINVVTIELPPLRDRGTDVLALAQQFLERIAERHGKRVRGIHADAAKRLLDYSWPGNVRELENTIDRAVALTVYEEIVVADLPPHIRDHQAARLPGGSEEVEALLTLAELEERYIHRVLAAVDNNKSHAARVLGIDRRTLYRKLERLGSEGR